VGDVLDIQASTTPSGVSIMDMRKRLVGRYCRFHHRRQPQRTEGVDPAPGRGLHVTISSVDAGRTKIDGVPGSDIDLHTEENLRDSLEVFARLRETGPVVWLEKYGIYALPRFAEVSRALKDWETFNSGQGVGFNQFFNSIKETSLQTHGELHDRIKHIESRPLAPEKLKELLPQLREYAEGLVKDLAGRTRVDGVKDIAMKMPMDIVTELVGLDDAGRQNLYTWGVEGFNSIGPLHAERTTAALQVMSGYVEYAERNIPAKIKPGGWADQLFSNGRAAGWSDELCRGVLNDYVYPSLDTTIHSMSTGLKLFAENPDQWAKVRADRSLLKSAVLEIVRLTTPIQYFTRLVTSDVEIGGVTLPAGCWVLVMFASANRDQREFADPDTFDVERNPAQMVGWGGGKHACLGRALARMEITTLFDVLADHYERFEIGDHAYGINNIIRGLNHLDLTLIPATQH
jgi:cytochrome P450